MLKNLWHCGWEMQGQSDVLFALQDCWNYLGSMSALPRVDGDDGGNVRSGRYAVRWGNLGTSDAMMFTGDYVAHDGSSFITYVIAFRYDGFNTSEADSTTVDDQYVIARCIPKYNAAADTGTATGATSSGGVGTLTNTNVSPKWPVNSAVGYTFTMDGKTLICTSNTAEVITGSNDWQGGLPSVGAYTVDTGGAGSLLYPGIALQVTDATPGADGVKVVAVLIDAANDAIVAGSALTGTEIFASAGWHIVKLVVATSAQTGNIYVDSDAAIAFDPVYAPPDGTGANATLRCEEMLPAANLAGGKGAQRSLQIWFDDFSVWENDSDANRPTTAQCEVLAFMPNADVLSDWSGTGGGDASNRWRNWDNAYDDCAVNGDSNTPTGANDEQYCEFTPDSSGTPLGVRMLWEKEAGDGLNVNIARGTTDGTMRDLAQGVRGATPHDGLNLGMYGVHMAQAPDGPDTTWAEALLTTYKGGLKAGTKLGAGYEEVFDLIITTIGDSLTRGDPNPCPTAGGRRRLALVI